jgi:RNA polymerase sigma factor (sigma-70 family)
MSNKLSRQQSSESGKGTQSEEEFWIDYYPQLQQYCHFLTQNKWDGDDMAQEAFLKALKHYSPSHNMSGSLLNKIAYHHWIDTVRKRKFELLDLESAGNPIYAPLDETVNTVDLLLKHFTPKQAIIFLLKEAFQYKTKEIADILCTTDMAVKASLHRAKKRLEKANLEEDDFMIDSFWDVKEREQLSDLFHESLQTQDPSVLIEAVPALVRDDVPSMMSRLPQPSTHTPSSTLLMAA